MLSERRHRIFARASFVETVQLYGFAAQPAHRLPEAIVHERMIEYFRYRLREALEDVAGAALGEVLIAFRNQSSAGGRIFPCGKHLVS